MKILNYIVCILLLVFFQVNNTVNASGVFTELSLVEKVQKSQYIIEGQMLSQSSFWDQANNQILTAYEVLVYKSFKNEIVSDHIWIITDGGVVGEEMHKVFPEFQTKIGEVGLFFLKENPATKYWNGAESALQFRLISNNEAMIKYDLKEKKAYDYSTVYLNIEEDLYAVVNEKMKSKFVVWNTLNNKEFAKNENSSDYKNTSSGTIDCIYPNVITGGTDAVLTITGEGFGVYGFNSKVKLKDPNTGGQSYKTLKEQHIIFWDENTIEVLIPDNVGSGIIAITTNNNVNIESEEELLIKFAVNTSGSEESPSMLVNSNGAGGYSFSYSTNISNGGVNFANSPATVPFERALERLQEEAGFNAMIAGTTNINEVSNDGYNVVMYDNNSDAIGAAGLLHAQYSKCGGMWEVIGMDITFRRDGTGSPVLNWNYETDLPAWNELDFESVAMHELIHGMQLKHNVQEPSLMYFAYSFGQAKRELHGCFDMAAIEVVNERSIIYAPWCNGNYPYQMHESFLGYNYDSANCISATECNPDLGNRLKAKALLGGFMTNTGLMSEILSENEILPFQQPFNQAPWNYNGTENTFGTLPENVTDWVLISMHDANNPHLVVAQKAAFLNVNGEIVDATGEEGIEFPSLEAGEYHISIRHCSHLGVLSNKTVDFPNSLTYDFTQDLNNAMGTDQQQLTFNKYTMIPGDYDGSGIINNLDYNKWTLQNSLVNEYVPWDGDGNGVVNSLDFNLWNVNKSKIGIIYLQQ